MEALGPGECRRTRGCWVPTGSSRGIQPPSYFVVLALTWFSEETLAGPEIFVPGLLGVRGGLPDPVPSSGIWSILCMGL